MKHGELVEPEHQVWQPGQQQLPWSTPAAARPTHSPSPLSQIRTQMPPFSPLLGLPTDYPCYQSRLQGVLCMYAFPHCVGNVSINMEMHTHFLQQNGPRLIIPVEMMFVSILEPFSPQASLLFVMKIVRMVGTLLVVSCQAVHRCSSLLLQPDFLLTRVICPALLSRRQLQLPSVRDHNTNSRLCTTRTIKVMQIII